MIRWCLAIATVSIFAVARAAEPPQDKSSIYRAGEHLTAAMPASPGPHLFIDDALIESSHNLVRRVCQPPRDATIPNPLVTGKEDRCYQPYFSVEKDPTTGKFRIWYGTYADDNRGSKSHLATMEGDDGIHWTRPMRILKDPGPIQFGSEVIDQGPACKDPSQRYVFSYWHDGGLNIAVSADGYDFRPLQPGVILKHNHDITNVSWDDLRHRYVATVSFFIPNRRFKGERRTTMQSVSDDLLHWTEPAIILCADDKFDEGQTQFYAMNGYLTRGPLRIGMVKVLRDDLFSDSKDILEKRGGGYGIGYTSLAWTRDGEHWVRDRDIFLDRGAEGSWDRSHAWIDEQLVMGDEVYLYYAGYKSGHKANRSTDRQIGLVKMSLDRYVAREPADAAKEATLLTTPIEINGRFSKLLVNAKALDGGSILVRLLDPNNAEALKGKISGDGIHLPVRWSDEQQAAEQLAAMEGKQVRLEFHLSRSRLFSFEFAP